VKKVDDMCDNWVWTNRQKTVLSALLTRDKKASSLKTLGKGDGHICKTAIILPGVVLKKNKI